MSDQTSIFNNNTNSEETPPQNQNPPSNGVQAPNNTNDFADLLSSIKNEHGEPKYKTIQDALVGLKNAQEYIPGLKSQLTQREQELAQAKAEAERIKELERVVQELTQRQTTTESTPPVGIDEEKVAELVARTLTRKQQEEVAKTNVQAVVTTLQQSFGADAEKKFYGKAEELGMSVAEMNALAAKSPKAVLTMLGIQGQQAPSKPPVPTTGSANTNGFQPTQESFVGRNTKAALVGATTEDLKEASNRAKKMVEELHAQGKSVHDLTDPKVFAQYFK